MRVVLPIVVASMAGAVAASAQKTADLDFTYNYPAQARAIPALRAWFDRDAAQQRARYARDAAADRRDALKDKRPFHQYEDDNSWKVVTDTPRFLSLSLEAWDYTGGAHGNTDFDSMIWDKTAQRRLAPMSFFTGPQALAGAVRAAFCRELDAQRERKRADQGGGDTLPEFNQCIDPTKQTLILGSSTRQRFDHIDFLIAPYEAGPYAEGTYEVTLPVTPQIIAAVKPEWRRYFTVGR